MLEEKRGDPYLVKEMIPGDNVENICPFPNIWSMEPFVNSVGGDQNFVGKTYIANEPSRVIEP